MPLNLHADYASVSPNPPKQLTTLKECKSSRTRCSKQQKACSERLDLADECNGATDAEQASTIKVAYQSSNAASMYVVRLNMSHGVQRGQGGRSNDRDYTAESGARFMLILRFRSTP